MPVLNFKGPFHFNHLNSLPDVKRPGIYIWGFVYEYDNDQLTYPVDFSKVNVIPKFNEDGCELNRDWLFLPYYVGLDKSLFNRISNHYYVRESSARLYKRFTLSFLRDFFKADSGFFPTTGSDRTICESIWNKGINNCDGCHYKKLVDDKKLDYINVKRCLGKIYGEDGLKCINDQWPITMQQQKNGNIIPDTLDFIVNKLNNFWFYYAVPKENENNLVITNDLKKLETYVFWSLKGKTISQTGIFPGVQNEISITPRSIFKDGNCKSCEKEEKTCTCDVIQPCLHLPGYL